MRYFNQSFPLVSLLLGILPSFQLNALSVDQKSQRTKKKVLMEKVHRIVKIFTSGPLTRVLLDLLLMHASVHGAVGVFPVKVVEFNCTYIDA